MMKKLKEGVADKYLQKNFKGYFIDDFHDFNNKYRMKDIDKNMVVYKRDDGWTLLKNPNSFEYLGKGVRGVILLNGDLYIEAFSKGTIHNDILTILFNEGILPTNPGKNWGKKLPQETGFLTVQRYKDTDNIAIGESNKIIYDEEDWNNLIHNYNEVLEKVREKNPKLNFSNKLVGVKFHGLKSETGTNTLKENNFL